MLARADRRLDRAGSPGERHVPLLDRTLRVGRLTSEDHLPVRSDNDRALRIVQRIADALGIPAEAFLANAAPGSWSEPTARVGDDMAEREPRAAEEYRSRTLPAPATKNPDRERQAAEMQALFDRVFELAEREACLSFVRARAVG